MVDDADIADAIFSAMVHAGLILVGVGVLVIALLMNKGPLP
jgi:hypothetical protein